MAQFIMARIGRFALKHKAAQARRQLDATISKVASKLSGAEERRDPPPALEEHPFAVASSAFLLGLFAGGELMLPSVVMLGSLLEIMSRKDGGRD